MPKSNDGQDREKLHKVFTHALRVKILRTLQNLGTCSPNVFSEGTKGTEEEVDLNTVAYHFRVLAKANAIELVDKVQRRGATEHVYRINLESPVLDLLRAGELLTAIEEWSPEREQADAGHPVAILPVDVDRQGQTELDRLMDGMRSSVKELARECRRRLTGSETPPIKMRVGLATYRPDSNGAPPPEIG
jgi:hypothetical protein